jgi:hypothetical protein
MSQKTGDTNNKGGRDGRPAVNAAIVSADDSSTMSATGAAKIREAVAAAKPHARRPPPARGSKATGPVGRAKADAGASASAPVGMVGDGGELRARRADRSVEELIDELEVWCTPTGEAYATVPINEHLENWPIYSDRFKSWLRVRARWRGDPLLGAGEID